MNDHIQIIESFVKKNQSKWFWQKISFVLALIMATTLILINSIGFLDSLSPFNETTLACFTIFIAVLFTLTTIIFYLKYRATSKNRQAIASLLESENRLFLDSLNALESTTFQANKSILINFIAEKTANQIKENQSQIFIKNKTKRKTQLSTLLSICLIILFFYFYKSMAIKTTFGLKSLIGKSQSPLEVLPGNLDVPKFTSFKITAKWLRPYENKSDLTIHIHYQSGKSDAIKMHKINKNSFVYQHYDTTENFTYYINSSESNSSTYNVTVFELPELMDQEITVTPPHYTGLESVTYKDFAYVSAPQNSKLIYKLKTNKPVESWLINKTAQFKFNKQKDLNYFFQHLATEYMEYHLLLKDNEKHEYKTMPEYILEVIPDLEPIVELTHPAKDIDVLGVEDLEIQFFSKDDFGVVEAKLIIESPIFKTKEININLSNIQNKKDFTDSMSLNLIDFGLNNGDLISIYIKVKDNSEPTPHYTISTPRILTVIPGDIKKDKEKNDQNQEGKDEEKKDIHFDDIIAELKRIYRESLKLNSITDLELFTDKTNILSNALSDLNVNFIRRVEPILNITKQQPKHPINNLVIRIKETLKTTENLMREKAHSASTSNQLKALQLINEFVAMLSPDQESQGKGNGQSDQESKEEDEKQKEKKEELANKIKNWLEELKDLKSRNDTISSNMGKNSGSMSESEKNYFAERKKEIKDQIQSISDQMQENKEVFTASDFLNQSGREFTNQIQNIQKGSRMEALKFDAKANWHLEKALETLEKLAEKKDSNDLSSLSDLASDMIKKQKFIY